MTGLAGHRTLAAAGARSSSATALTEVELIWIEKSIEYWVRFGKPVQERIIDRRRRVLGFRPGSLFAFMAGYGLKSFLIAQSLNQIEKAYGPNNSILDNCHVRVSFATNDERTAKRVSDALGTATEMKAMKNYAGHRLSPWLGHLMVSRSETARQLLTPGEIMQLPPTDEIVMVAGTPPIRAKKARYYEDRRFTARVLPPPELIASVAKQSDDWSALPLPESPRSAIEAAMVDDEDPTQSEHRQQPELSRVNPVEKSAPIENEFDPLSYDGSDDEAARSQRLTRVMRGVARQVSMDPGDGMEL